MSWGLPSLPMAYDSVFMMLLKKCRLTLVQTFWWGVFMKLVESGSGLKGFDSG